VTATTFGLVGLATVVLTSCRGADSSIPDGNGAGTGATIGAQGPAAGGVSGADAPGGTGGAPLPPDDGPGGQGAGGNPSGPTDHGSNVGGSGGVGGTGMPRAGIGSGGVSGMAPGTGGQAGSLAPSNVAGSSGQAGPPASAGGAAGNASGGQSGLPAASGGASGNATGGVSTGGAPAPVGAGGMPASGGAATGGAGGQADPGSPAVPPGSGGSGFAGASGAPVGGNPPPAAGGSSGTGGSPLAFVTSDDIAGAAITLRLFGPLTDSADDFNAPLGTNGRGCATCHDATQAMSLTPAGAQARFDASQGTDPLFRPVDGAVSPLADVSTLDARHKAYALLLSKGLIRVGLPIPANADFDLVAVADPYGYASAAELSLFRRPLPAANLPFLSTIMWDGREGVVTHDDPTNTLLSALASQAGHAVLGHSQASSPLEPTRVAGIVNFELSIFSAQATNLTAGPLNGASALGGPLALTQQTFYPGINDPNGADPTSPFTPNAFTMYVPWQATEPQGSDADARRQIALGEQLFNTRSFSVTGVTGLTTPEQPTVTVTCSTCHDAPGAGSNSNARFFDLGLSSAARAGTDLPVYTLQERSTGKQALVSDPGRALITGAFKDVATFKVPTLRGLAARAPYFHNGAAATLSGVVGFYNGRFGIGLSSDEKAALAAFLSSL